MTSGTAHADSSHDSVVAKAQRVADEVLFPLAQTVDRSPIPATHVEALRDTHLFSFIGAAPADIRRAMAAIAGGCGATFFVWAQHHGVVRNVATSTNAALRAALLPSLLDGSIVAGTAFAHVRRTGSVAVRATRIDGGWKLDGLAPWATSWGIADRFTIAAITDDGRVVWAVLPGDGGPGVTTDELELPVFSSTGTVALRFDGAPIADADVLKIENAERWRTTDRQRASVGAPAVLGVVARAIGLLRDASLDDDDRAHAAAERLDMELTERWLADDRFTTELDSLADDATGEAIEHLIAAASAHRAECLGLGQRATTALLAAVGGGGMDLSHPAQRLSREAAFYVIQAQTGDGRAATLDAV